MTDREEWRPEQCPICGDLYSNVYETDDEYSKSDERDPKPDGSVCVDDGTAYVHDGDESEADR